MVVKPVQIVSGKKLIVTLADGTTEVFRFSKWQTEDELAVYDERGELCAVFAKGAWTKAVVENPDEVEPEADDGE